MHHAEKFLTLVRDALSRVQEVDIQTVKAMSERQERFVLIDVREESEWANAHLPEAIHLSKGIIERDIEKRVPDTQTKIVLYCGGGFRSALAADNLKKMGYQHVFSMQGGFAGWVQAGLDVIVV